MKKENSANKKEKTKNNEGKEDGRKESKNRYLENTTERRRK